MRKMISAQSGGRLCRHLFQPEMDSQNSANDVFVDLDAEGQTDLLGNALAAPAAIASLRFHNGIDEFFRGSFGTWPLHPFG